MERLQSIKQGIKGFFEAEPLPPLSMPDPTASNRAITFVDQDELELILEECREKRAARLGVVSLEETTQLKLPFPRRVSPLAVRIGLWVDDIPADGWPDKFDPEVCERILSYLPEHED
jgi:hypothetical protein